MEQNEKLNQEEIFAINDMKKTMRILELEYQNLVLRIQNKYGLKEGDSIGDDGTIVREQKIESV